MGTPHTAHRTPHTACHRWRKAITAAGKLSLCLMLVVSHLDAAKATDKVSDNCTLVGSNLVIAHVVGTFDPGVNKEQPVSEWFDLPHTPAWSCIRYSQASSTTIEVIVKYLTPGERLKKTSTLMEKPTAFMHRTMRVIPLPATVTIIKTGSGLSWSAMCGSFLMSALPWMGNGCRCMPPMTITVMTTNSF